MHDGRACVMHNQNKENGMESIHLDLVECHGAYVGALNELTAAVEALGACGYSKILFDKVQKLRAIFMIEARRYQECLKRHGKDFNLKGL